MMVYESDPPQYHIDFVDGRGETIAFELAKESQLRLVITSVKP